MPHVTFIHGLSNKPEAEILHQIWKRALMNGANPLDLGDRGVTTSMVYWADVLYPAPDPNVADYESAQEKKPEEVDGSGGAGIPVGTTEAEKYFLKAFRARQTRMSDPEIEATKTNTADDDMATQLERIPLPWWIKKKIMAAQIRDAYLYLFNKAFSPRPETTYLVQDEIRRRFIAALKAAPADGPHVVVSHSMGTMVAYDCLKRVPDCPAIDGLMTMGSPLGVDEVQDCFKPEWTRENGYPGDKIKASWVNLFDRLDVVCGADPELANDYYAASVNKIKDISVTNDGAWRHSIVKYFARDETRHALAEMLVLKLWP